MTSIRAPRDRRSMMASISANSLEGLAKHKRLRNPRSTKLSTTRHPIKPAAPVIKIRSSGPTTKVSCVVCVCMLSGNDALFPFVTLSPDYSSADSTGNSAVYAILQIHIDVIFRTVSDALARLLRIVDSQSKIRPRIPMLSRDRRTHGIRFSSIRFKHYRATLETMRLLVQRSQTTRSDSF